DRGGNENIGAGARAARRAHQPNDDGLYQQRPGKPGHAQPTAGALAKPKNPVATQRTLSPPHQKTLQPPLFLLAPQNFAARLADYAGHPVDRLLRMMPKPASAGLNRAIEAAILKCLNLAISSIEPKSKQPPATKLSSLLAGINGGISGFFGFAALPI